MTVIDVVCVPPVYDGEPPGIAKEKQKEHREDVLAMMNAMLHGCRVFVRAPDPSYPIAHDTSQLIRRWPDQTQRKKATLLLQELRKRRRFHPQHDCAPMLVPIAGHTGCEYSFGMAASKLPDVLVTTTHCAVCANLMIPVEKCTIGRFSSWRGQPERAPLLPAILGWKEWKADRFERYILSPILTGSRYMCLYDKFIGDSPEALEWLYRCFLDRSAEIEDVRFEVICGFEGGDAQKARDVRQMAAALSREFGVPFTLHLKWRYGYGVNQNHMHHDRFLFTDRGGLSCGPGFDLVRLGKKKGKVIKMIRDATLTECHPDDLRSQWEKEERRLAPYP